MICASSKKCDTYNPDVWRRKHHKTFPVITVRVLELQEVRIRIDIGLQRGWPNVH